MRRFGFGFALVGLLAASAAGQDKDEVAIKRYTAKAGDKTKVTKTEKGTSTTTFTIGGKEQTKVEESSKTIVYVEQIDTPGPGEEKPLKFTRTYTKYEISKAGKDDAATPPLDTPITFERKGDKYTYTAEKPIDAAFAKKLNEEFAKGGGDMKGDEFLPPGGKAKVGVPWKPDVKKFAKAMASDGKLVLDPEATELTCTLLKTSTKGGKQYGDVQIKFAAPIKDLGNKDITVKSGTMAMTMSGDVCLDGTDPTEKGTGEMAFTVEAETKGITFKVSAKVQMTNSREVVK